MYGQRIKMIRELRNYSQEYVAGKIGVKQNTYSKIETNQSKLSADMLEKIAEALEVSPTDIMTNQPAIVNLQPNKGTQQSFAYIDTFVSSQKELVDKIVQSKDEEIKRLVEQNKLLMELLKKENK